MIFGVGFLEGNGLRADDIEGNGLRARDKGNCWKELRWVEGRFNSARGDDTRGDDTRGDDTRGEKVVCAGREKRGQESKK